MENVTRVVDPLPEMMASAWMSVREELAADGERWRSAATGPVASVSEAASRSAARDVADEALALIVRAALESAVRAHSAVVSRMVTPERMQAVMQSVTGFAIAVAEGRDAVCAGAECDWRGKVADMGPIARCVKCGGPARPVAKMGLVNGQGKPL